MMMLGCWLEHLDEQLCHLLRWVRPGDRDRLTSSEVSHGNQESEV